MQEAKATSGSYYGTDEERAQYQQKAWSMAGRHNGGAVLANFMPQD